jgi:putative phage-type endonuclease
MRIIECEQGTPEWHAARCGRVTSSGIADLMRKVANGKPSKMRQTYLGKLVAERLSGQKAETFQSKAMEWGKETEDEAAQTYAFMHGINDMRKIGFAVHDRFEMWGCSPDRLIGDDGLIEIKCPQSATHIESLLGGPIDPDYVYQMQCQMAVTGRKWCDWISYDPRFPPEMQMHVRRVVRDPVVIVDLERAVTQFLSEVDDTVRRLRERFKAAA